MFSLTGFKKKTYSCVCLFLTEIEAKEACDWLRAAGFPQYAQLYEGNTRRERRSRPLLFIPALCSYLSTSLLFLSAIASSLHRRLLALCSISRPQFLSRRRRSWERPHYHCWDSHSFLFSLFLLPPFSISPPLSSHLSTRASKPAFSCNTLVFLFSQRSSLLPCLPSAYVETLQAFIHVLIVRSHTGTNRKWSQ